MRQLELENFFASDEIIWTKNITLIGFHLKEWIQQQDVDSDPFCLDFTINIDIKCPISMWKKKNLLIYTEQAWQHAFIGLWTLQTNLQTQLFVSAASVVDDFKKRVLREAGLRRLQLTVGYKLYINFNAKPLVLFWKYLPHLPVANTMLWSGFGK